MPLSRERDQMLRTAPQTANVWKNAWWFADCPKHGRQAHHGQFDGRCERCHAEGLKAQGLLEVGPRVRNMQFYVEIKP